METKLPVAFLAGFVSVVTPCVLPLVPGYLSALSSVRPGERWVDNRRQGHDFITRLQQTRMQAQVSAEVGSQRHKTLPLTGILIDMRVGSLGEWAAVVDQGSEHGRRVFGAAFALFARLMQVVTHDIQIAGRIL